MYSPSIKRKVRLLRENGKSLQDIVSSLKLNKSTVSFWCRNIQLSESTLRKIKYDGNAKSMAGLLRYSEIKRSERMERTKTYKQEGALLVGKLSERDILMAGLGLYWGEGYKESNSELGFTNSSFKIIDFYLKWLSLLKVSKNDLIFRLTINKFFKKYEKDIKNFWMRSLSVKEAQFSKTTIIKTNLKKASLENRGKYRGILRVKVRRGLSLKNKILGAIDHISKKS